MTAIGAAYLTVQIPLAGLRNTLAQYLPGYEIPPGSTADTLAGFWGYPVGVYLVGLENIPLPFKSPAACGGRENRISLFTVMRESNDHMPARAARCRASVSRSVAAGRTLN